MRLFLACWMTMSLASPALSATLAGDWETVIDSPRRPWIFETHFEGAGERWTGVMRVRGYGELPLTGVHADGDRVRFVFPAELDSTAFEGAFTDSGIVGQVVQDGQPVPTRLTRIVALPEPANRIEAWRQDLAFARAKMLAYDRSFSPAAREEFAHSIDAIVSGLARENDAQILTALGRAVALADNAHTRLRLDPTSQGVFSTEFPLALWWFSDGPYVVRAAPGYESALRCRLVAINGRDVAEARRLVRPMFAGNESWADYLTPLYLMRPDVLYGLGLSGSRDQVQLTLQDVRGRRFPLLVRAAPVHDDTAPMESWQEISPALSLGTPPWIPALPAGPRLPLYLRHPDRPYWFEFSSADGLLYFQYNRSEEAENGPPFQAFADSMMAFAHRHELRAMVVDLRLNGGGNLDVAKSFMERLGADSLIDRPGRLFVITGHVTFSAGLYHAAQLKQLTHATFVGEKVGDRLDFWAEGGRIVLPNSQAAISYANGLHRYSGQDEPGHPPYYEALSVASLKPDIPVALSAADYFALRDPALDAIRATAASPRSSP